MPVEVLDKAGSHRKLTFLFLCFLRLVLLCFGERALRFRSGWLLPGFDVCFLHMPLAQHDARLMVDQTHGMDRIAMLLFKLQSPLWAFPSIDTAPSPRFSVLLFTMWRKIGRNALSTSSAFTLRKRRWIVV